MAISFNEIPIDIRTFGSYVEFDGSRAVQGLAAQPHVGLIIAQKRATGTIAADTPTFIASADAALSLFGVGSHGAHMCRAWKDANRGTELWAIALDDDGAATAATFTLTVTGPATADGTFYVYIGGERIAVAVESGDTDSDIATKINAAIQAVYTTAKAGLPVTSSAALAVVTLTAVNKGTVSNGLDVRLNYYQGEALPAGVGVTVAAGVSGATDPDLTAAIAAMGDTQYHTVVHPFNTGANFNTIEAELDRRWGPMTQIEGQAYTAVPGTQAQATAITSLQNSKFVTSVAAQTSPTPYWQWAAAVAAIDAAQTQIDPARPRQTLPITGALPPSTAVIFTREERDNCLRAGAATYVVDAGGRCLIERLITTYQSNIVGPDTTFLDITTMRTLAYLRYSLRIRLAQRYPRHKLASDGTQFAPGQAIVTPSSIRSDILAWFRLLEFNGYVEGYDQFTDDLIVERDGTDPNRVNALLGPDIINQFRVFAGQIQFLL